MEESALSERNHAGNPKGKDYEDTDSHKESQKSAGISCLRNKDFVESNYYSDSSSGSHKPSRNSNNQEGANDTVQYLDQDRAELLRKLDEIKEQLIWNPNLVDKPKHSGQTPTPFFGPGPPGKHVPRPYFHHYPEPFPYPGPHQMPMHGLYPSTSNPRHIPGYADPFWFQMRRRPPPNFFLGQDPHQPYFPGQYVDIGSDIVESHPQDSIFHPYFSAPPSHFGDIPYSPASYHLEKIGPFSPHNYTNPRTSIPSPLHSSGPQTHKRWQGDFDSEMGVGDLARHYAPKVVSASGARHYRPLAGGAPFIACHNCFELLHLPKKVLKKQKQMMCGACSELISFTIVNKKLVLSSGNEDTHPVSRGVDVTNSMEDAKDATISNSSAHVTRLSGNFSSVDYDNSGYDFHSMDSEPVEALRKPRDVRSVHSSSSTDHAEDEKDFHSSKTRTTVAKPVQHPVKDEKTAPPPTGSSLQELFEYSTANRAALSYGIENLSLGSDKEYMMQNSVKEVAVATETDVSFNGYSNTEASQDSKDDDKREDDRRRGKKGSDSAFANIFRRSFRSRNEERDKYEVWVNGHLIPEDLVKDAEKLAGPIQPGNYWYDYRAGFWGVMGKPCLGIIMPFIEEFNYPMPDKCAGGDTGVFVNGRELHQRDLDMLAGRRLPTDKNRYYIVDISGRVLDGDTGEELDSLGRLAPTIQKEKRGFGMKVPRAFASRAFI